MAVETGAPVAHGTVVEIREPVDLPRPLAVEVDPAHHEPARVQHRGRWSRVASVQNQWRIDDEWWRQPLSRHYYQLELSSGVLLTIFHDLVMDAWWEQRA